MCRGLISWSRLDCHFFRDVIRVGSVSPEFASLAQQGSRDLFVVGARVARQSYLTFVADFSASGLAFRRAGDLPEDLPRTFEARIPNNLRPFMMSWSVAAAERSTKKRHATDEAVLVAILGCFTIFPHQLLKSLTNTFCRDICVICIGCGENLKTHFQSSSKKRRIHSILMRNRSFFTTRRQLLNGNVSLHHLATFLQVVSIELRKIFQMMIENKILRLLHL